MENNKDKRNSGGLPSIAERLLSLMIMNIQRAACFSPAALEQESHMVALIQVTLIPQ